MRSAGAGLFGALLMVAPLVAIPILAVVGVPQFAPATASLDPLSVDTELSADLAADDPEPGRTKSRSPRPGGPAARFSSDDLFSEDSPSEDSETGDLSADNESDHGEPTRSGGRESGRRGMVREFPDEPGLGDDDSSNSAPPHRSSAANNQGLGNDWEVEELDEPAEMQAGAGTRPLPAPRSSSSNGNSSRQRDLNEDTSEATPDPIDVVGSTTRSLNPSGKSSAQSPEENRQWSNQAPSERLGDWEAETRSPTPSKRPAATPRSEQYAAAADGAIDFMAPRSQRAGDSRPRPAQRAPAAPPTRSNSTPDGTSGVASLGNDAPRNSGTSASSRVRPIPGTSPTDGAGSGNAGDNSEAVDAGEAPAAPLTRDRLRQQFRDPLAGGGRPAPNNAERPAARPSERATPPRPGDFSPSETDLSAGEPLVPVDAAPAPADPGENNAVDASTDNPEVDLGDAGEARSLAANPSEIDGAADVPTDVAGMDDSIASEQLSWTQAKDRLKAWGITNYRVRNTDEGRFLFYCTAPDRKSSQVSRRFEAEADTPLEAVNMAITEIATWYRSAGRGSRQ
jgi:hypothetical protein